MHHPLTRRAWLRQATASALPVLSPLALNLAAMQQAAAATTSGYKALVCVFLFGGNDAYNTVLATDSASWQAYEAARRSGSVPIALAAPGTPAQPGGATLHQRLGGVLPIQPLNPGRSLALHPVMGGVRDLFQARRLALVSNVGPLVEPLSKADWLAGRGSRPAKLFSHNDQQAAWQALAAEGSHQGWGGGFVDPSQAVNAHAGLGSISVHGRAVWGVGRQGVPYQLAPGGAIRMGGSGAQLFGSAGVQQALQTIARGGRSTQVLEAEHAAVSSRSIAAEALLSGALPALGTGPWSSPGAVNPALDPLLSLSDPVSGSALFNPLAFELQAVARSIAARDALGMSRQVFFVGLSGFDTHDAQCERHARVLAQLTHALAYFDRVLTQMGVDQQVTTFTASDFGRSLASNGDGSDHGWGGHHLVMGGAVRGGQVYGSLPVYGAADGRGGFDSPDQLAGGALLPSTPLQAYAATLGRWFGLSDSELLGTLPGLGHWAAGARQLGFMG